MESNPRPTTRPEFVDQRWSFRCPTCGAFKIADLRVYSGGRVEHVRLVEKLHKPLGVEAFTYVNGKKMPLPRRYQVIEGTATTLFAEQRCPCGTRVEGEVVTGHFSRESICDDRCTSATGDDCDCQCGGANHGISWVGLGWRLVFRLDGSRVTKIRPESSVAATAETIAAAKLARKTARDAKDAEKRATEERTMRGIRETFAHDFPEIVAWLGEHRFDDTFLESVAGQLDRKGHLSPGQIRAVERSMDRDRARQAAAAALASVPPAPDGAATVVGEVVNVREKPGYMGQTKYRMTVKLDDGNRVSLNIPNELYRQIVRTSSRDELSDSHWTALLQGRRVRFTATFTRSDQVEGFRGTPDVHLSFGKLPRKAELLAVQTV